MGGLMSGMFNGKTAKKSNTAISKLVTTVVRCSASS